MKTTIDIDKELAADAATVLGTTTLRDTVQRSLEEVVAQSARHRLAERVRSGTLPVPTAAELRRLRAPRLPAGALARTQRPTG